MTTETWSLLLWLLFGFIGFYLLTQLIDFVRWWVASRKKIN